MCGKCEFCRRVDGEWRCDNDESENYGIEVEYDYDCVDFMERDEQAWIKQKLTGVTVHGIRLLAACMGVNIAMQEVLPTAFLDMERIGQMKILTFKKGTTVWRD